MAKFNLRSKRTWKKILSIGLGILLTVGAVFGISALVSKSEETTKEISPKFSIGALTEDGKYSESKESIYSDAFECQGLDIELEFDHNISYRVFFYGSENNFISSTDESTEVFDESSIPMLARYARIVITPTEDSKISWYEVSKYSKQLSITVNKEQEWIYSENLFAIDNAMHGNYWYGLSSNTTLIPIEATTDTYSSAFVDCTGYSRLVVGIVLNGDGEEFNFENIYFGTDTDNNKLSTIQAKCSDSDNVGDIEYHTYIIPQGATRFAINYNAKTINGTFVYGIK